MKNPIEPRKPSEARLKANRENARKSTGPRTAEGKNASSRNRLLHGLRASKHILLDENPEEFLILLHDHFDRFQPVGDSEEKLVLRIANDQWRLHRALAFEAGIFRDRFPNVAAKDKTRQEQYAREKRYAAEDGKPEPPPPIVPSDGDLPARAFNVDCEGPNSFAKFSRYEAAIERSIDRCLRQLKIYQSARQSNPVDPLQPPAPGADAERPVPPAPAGAACAPMPAEPTDCHSNPTGEETSQSRLARLPLLVYTLLSALPNLLACTMPYAMAYALLRTGRRQFPQNRSRETGEGGAHRPARSGRNQVPGRRNYSEPALEMIDSAKLGQSPSASPVVLAPRPHFTRKSSLSKSSKVSIRRLASFRSKHNGGLTLITFSSGPSVLSRIP
jgi:hypothetical protein